MTAWWAVWCHEARRNAWRAVLLGVFVAVAGGVVLASFIGVRRESTVVPRALRVTNAATVGVLPNDVTFDWAPVAELPGVTTLQRIAITGFTVAGHDGLNAAFPRPGPPTGGPVETVVAIEGRVADESRFDEVTVDGPAAAREHIALGDDLTILLTPGPDLVASYDDGRLPDGSTPIEVPVHVVGITKGGPFGGELQTTAAFSQRYADDLIPPGHGYVNAIVRLDGGRAAIPAFSAEVDRIAGRPVEVMDVDSLVRSVRQATGLETAALMAFAITALLLVVVLGGIWMGRTVGASTSSVTTLRGLGFTRRQGIALAATLPALGTVVGALGAVVVAIALSSRFPIGLGRVRETSPGVEVHVVGLVIGAVSIAGLGLVAAITAAHRSQQDSHGDLAGSGMTTVVMRPPLPLTIGARLAVTGRRSGGSRAATAALVLGAITVMGASTFAAGLRRAATDGRLAGQRFDSMASNPGTPGLSEELRQAWRVDERVATAERVLDLVVDANGEPLALFGSEQLKGDPVAVALRGRLPSDAGEVTLAPGELERFGVDIGDTLRLADGSPLRVVGVAFSPSFGHTEYSAGGQVTIAQANAIVDTGVEVKFDMLAMTGSRRLDDDELASVWQGIAFGRVGPVEAQVDLGRTQVLPRVLAWFAACLAGATAAIVLAATTRRRRRDVAIMQVLGLTRRQARSIVGWQAFTSAAIAVIAGVPIGYALGRTLWQAVAEDLPLQYVTPTAWASAVAVMAGLTVAVVVVAARPLVTTARAEPAALLRVE